MSTIFDESYDDTDNYYINDDDKNNNKDDGVNDDIDDLDDNGVNDYLGHLDDLEDNYYDDEENDISFMESDVFESDKPYTINIHENLPSLHYLRTYYGSDNDDYNYNNNNDIVMDKEEAEAENNNIPQSSSSSSSSSSLSQFPSHGRASSTTTTNSQLYTNQKEGGGGQQQQQQPQQEGEGEGEGEKRLIAVVKLCIRLINTNIYIYNTNMISFKNLIKHLSIEYTRISEYTLNITDQVLGTISKLFNEGKYNSFYYKETVLGTLNVLKNYAIALIYIFYSIASYIRNLEKTLINHAWLLIRAIWLVYHIRVFFGNLPDKTNDYDHDHYQSDLVNIISNTGRKITQAFLNILRSEFLLQTS